MKTQYILQQLFFSTHRSAYFLVKLHKDCTNQLPDKVWRIASVPGMADNANKQSA